MLSDDAVGRRALSGTLPSLMSDNLSINQVVLFAISGVVFGLLRRHSDKRAFDGQGVEAMMQKVASIFGQHELHNDILFLMA